jgi:hypothetical protein
MFNKFQNLPRNIDEPYFVNIQEIKERVSLIRDCVRIWDYFRNNKELSIIVDNWESSVWNAPRNKGEALYFLCEVLDAALKPFHVRTQLNIGNIIELQKPRPSLYSALCLQLTNHISENSKYDYCGNETCNNLFVRQRGRAKFNQYRNEGVIYCSNDCAKAQAQREYRRRERDKTKAKKEAKNGKHTKKGK